MMNVLKSKYTWRTKISGVIKDQDLYQVVLSNRGIDDPEHFFSMGKEMLHSPFLINDMEKAVGRINQAIERQEKIVIFGDYDCDGITAISVLYRALKKKNANVSYDLPDRFVDGYGLNIKASHKMIQEDVKLVITVDNGITCIDEVALLNEHGIDTIITDHHEAKEELPKAFALVHPKLSQNYPYKEIAGVMVAYKLASALYGSELDDLFDLVMIGTIADLMPLEDENQAMVNLGLNALKNTSNLGLKKMIEYSHLDIINETAIAFKIAPKINSSGRLGKAKEAVKLLVSESESEVAHLILHIEENHANRKDLTEEAFLLCEKLVDPGDDVVVIHSPLLHEGVIGICAQKIAEKYQKSTVVITVDDEGMGKGSMRSFGGENILTMLENNKQYLEKFGGHSQAAGLQIKKDNIHLFKRELQHCSSHNGSPILEADALVEINHISTQTIKKLQDNSFFTALFMFEGLRIDKKQKMSDKHTKFVLSYQGVSIEALHFNSLEYYFALEVGDIVDLIGGMSINEWRNRQTIQILIKDIACKNFQVIDLRAKEEYDLGAPFIQATSLVIDDHYFLDHPQKSDLKDIAVKTIYICPKSEDTLLKTAVDKDTYRMVFKLYPEKTVISFQFLEKKSKLPLWVLKKVIQVFKELNFIDETNDGFIKRENIERTELVLSKTYQQLDSLNKRINWLYQDSIQNIHKTLNAWMEE